MRKIALIVLTLILVECHLPHREVAAKGARVINVAVEIEDKDIVVSADLVRGLSDKTVSDIHHGIPKDFYYYLVLFQKQKNWFDEEIASKTLRLTVKYDTLKKHYTVSQKQNEEVTEQVFPDFPSAQQILLKIDRVKLAPVSLLKQGKRYHVGIKSQMKASKFPLYLDYFLFFIPFLELDTPWSYSHTIDGIP